MAASAVYQPKFLPVNDPRMECVILGIWAASTAYVVGQIVRSGNGAGNYYQCMIAGTSNATAPTWTTTGALVTDNTVTWRDIGMGLPGDLVLRPNGNVGFISGLTSLGIERAVTFNYFSVGYVPKASATVFADGQDVFFNTATNLAVTTAPAQGFFVGTSRGGAASGTIQVLVWLNAGDTSAMPPFMIIAAAGTNQGNATVITTQRAYITGASGANGVKLPMPSTDLGVTVVNEANQPLMVYGYGTETVDGFAGGTGTNIAGMTVSTFRSDGVNWYSQRGYNCNGLTSFDNVAAAGTNQGTAHVISGEVYMPTSVGSGTGCSLPAASPGLYITVVNKGANALSMYSATGNINGTIGTTAYTIAVGKSVCVVSDGTNYYTLPVVPS
jgi:hypothetical protein